MNRDHTWVYLFLYGVQKHTSFLFVLRLLTPVRDDAILLIAHVFVPVRMLYVRFYRMTHRHRDPTSSATLLRYYSWLDE